MINEMEKILQTVPIELIQKLLYISDARGGAILLKDANEISKYNLKNIANNGYILSKTLKYMINGFMKNEQPITLQRLLKKLQNITQKVNV